MRSPCCERTRLKRGPWTPEEDELLVNFIDKNKGHGSWRVLPKLAGLLRCGKSCRLRWQNYLRPDIKRGPFSEEEEKLIIQLHGMLGNSLRAYPLIVAAHPSDPNQFALGLSDGGVHVLEPLESDGKWGTSPPTENGAEPSTTSGAAGSEQPQR